MRDELHSECKNIFLYKSKYIGFLSFSEGLGDASQEFIHKHTEEELGYKVVVAGCWEFLQYMNDRFVDKWIIQIPDP